MGELWGVVQEHDRVSYLLSLADEDEVVKEEIRTLVNYYINELKFRYVSKYKILKPHYERRCYTLVQEVEHLQSNRESVWQSHTTEDMK